MEADDMELLRDYVRTRSDQAFHTLVERQIHMVYSVALRETGQAHLAADVRQPQRIIHRTMPHQSSSRRAGR